MDYKQLAKQALNKLAGVYIKKIKIIAFIAIGVIVFLIMVISGGEDSKSTTGSTEGMTSVTPSYSDQFIEYLHAKEGGGTIYQNEDGVDCYQVVSDGSKNGSAVGYGVDIGVHGEELTALGYDTSIGSLIPVEVVDAIEVRIREDFYNQVKNQISSSGIELTQYQIYALTSRAYNCGVAGALTVARGSKNLNFMDAYKEYWSVSSDDKFSDQLKEGDYTHALYSEYMKDPTTSNGEYLAGLENRRKSEWTLFQCGYFDALGEWYQG